VQLCRPVIASYQATPFRAHGAKCRVVKRLQKNNP
jgi:hypothetical protein